MVQSSIDSSESDTPRETPGKSRDAVIRSVQDWIDHPSWDSQYLSESKDEDIQVCVDLFLRVAAGESITESVACDPADFWPYVDVAEKTNISSSTDRFSFERLLGVGAFGVVLCVYDKRLTRHVALKILRPSLGHSRILEQRFLREVQVAASLDHVGIVRVFETGRISGHPYIMIAVIDGPNLADYLKVRGGRIPQKNAARLMAKVADALQFAHERGVLHRDLKPSNILLECSASGELDDTEFHPKLTDFGLAKRVNHLQDAQENLSDGCQMLGTLRYMSPEQAAGRLQDVGIASDVYSLGAILHQALVGATPYDGRSSAETLTKILQNPVSSLRRFDAKIPHDLDNIVLKCLAREPRDRYASAGDLAADLNRFLRGEPVVAKKAGWRRRVQYWMKQNPAIAGMAGLSVTAIVGSLILVTGLYYRERQAVARADQLLNLTLKSLNDAYVDVAEEMLVDVQNSAEKRYELHCMALAAHREIAEQSGFDARSRHRLSVAYHYAGTAAERLGHVEEAEQFRSACIALLTGLLKEDPENPIYQYDLFFNRKCIADADTATDPRERIQRKEQVCDEILSLLRLAPANLQYRDAAAAAKMSLAFECSQTQRHRSPQFFQEAWEISDTLWAEHPEELTFVKYALLARAYLADLYREDGNLQEAERLGRDAIRIVNAILVERRDEIWFREIEREPMRSLAESCFALQKWAEAASLLQQCATIDETLYQFYPQHHRYLLGRCQFLIELVRAERHLSTVPPQETTLREIERLLSACGDVPTIAGRVVELRTFLSDTSSNPMKAGQ